ncbi:MAG: 3'-5' exonuclease domain-containing protein 2 [Desulfobulbus sp.]|jgi:ribonuclease D|uniref:3'-5' exonuclease n=1 Tax=Desulfobulbus sp. TaxID=895 RepID=UPI00284D0C6D|nr:3'-5' exonuclease [Desulfobulbus sp.]MDR2549627.1 3'-5' exonuclease domain-containing protein 2 [Desulfobulbus sp.]
MSKEAINALPLACWQGTIHCVRTAGEAEEAAVRLARADLLGFDTETRPAFHKGQKFAPSLLQLAAEDEVVLVQLERCGLPAPFRDLLEDPAIVKAGVAPDFDLKNLQGLHPFRPASFVDLARMAKGRGIRHHGLRGLAAVVCGFRISKSARTTNWASPELTARQIRYAATDAWIGREIYRQLLALAPAGA